ncbi:MAG: hypothetical protein A3E87_10780 [Gammaproteobacteria bacterium RIFCSPHIGHO2_12_FULL_35_23]|nr:MAG: hypothetical protein A3E87_10780 [Gammaproteobacteria bacterium RIFCSPHIGHO2_12_FULL_35_23]
MIFKPAKVSQELLHDGPGLADHTIYVEFWSQFADVPSIIILSFLIKVTFSLIFLLPAQLNEVHLRALCYLLIKFFLMKS